MNTVNFVRFLQLINSYLYSSVMVQLKRFYYSALVLKAKYKLKTEQDFDNKNSLVRNKEKRVIGFQDVCFT